MGDTATATVDPILERFKLGSIEASHQKTMKQLIENGLYYLTVSNSVSALVAFSSAASYLYSLQQSTTDTAVLEKYGEIMKILLGYVEKLQEDTKDLRIGGGGGKGKKEEEKDDWDVECECPTCCEEDPNKNQLTFDDVIGMKKEKEMFYASIVYPLIYPNLYTKTAKGVLLYGPPGTGKTYLIKAAIKELSIKYGDKVGVHFFPLTGADLKGKYVGETEKKIVKAYTCAARRACQATDVFNTSGPKKCKNPKEFIDRMKTAYASTKEGPNAFWKNQKQYVSVIFIDEFDAIGGDRSKDETGMVANAVNTMLQMMDGLQSFANIVTVCATNYPWNLDSALIRRFSAQIYCNVPTYSDIVELVRYDMKSRIKFIETNKQAYCAEKMGKQFTPSSELLELYKKPKGYDKMEAEKKEKQRNKRLAQMFNLAFLKDRSPEMMSIFSKLAEDRYSNSDITQMMQMAYNSVSASALDQSTWIQFPFVMEDGRTENFFVPSKLTKFDTGSEAYMNAFAKLKELENMASMDTVYSMALLNNSKERKTDIAVDFVFLNFRRMNADVFKKYKGPTPYTKDALKNKANVNVDDSLRESIYYTKYKLEEAFVLIGQELTATQQSKDAVIKKLTEIEAGIPDAVLKKQLTDQKTNIETFANERREENLGDKLSKAFSFESLTGFWSTRDIKKYEGSQMKDILDSIVAADTTLSQIRAARQAAAAAKKAKSAATPPAATTPAATTPAASPTGSASNPGSPGVAAVGGSQELEYLQEGGVPGGQLFTSIGQAIGLLSTPPPPEPVLDTANLPPRAGPDLMRYKTIFTYLNKLTDTKALLTKLNEYVTEFEGLALPLKYDDWKAKRGALSDADREKELKRDSTTLVIPGNIYVDEASSRSVFGGAKQSTKKKGEDEYQEVLLAPGVIVAVQGNIMNVGENQCTSIMFEKRKFINLRFLSDCPSVLMYNDMSISDVFYDPLEVDNLNLELYNSKLKDGKFNKDFEMSVVFSKPYTIDYVSSKGYEGYVELFTELKEIMSRIEAKYGSPESPDPLSYTIAWEPRPDGASGKTKLSYLGTARNSLTADPILTGKSTFTEEEQAEAISLDNEFMITLEKIDAIKAYKFEGLDDTIDRNWQAWRDAEAESGTYLISSKQPLFKLNSAVENPAWEFAKLVLQKKIEQKDKDNFCARKANEALTSLNGVTLASDSKAKSFNTTVKPIIEKILQHNNFIQFLKQAESSKLTALYSSEVTDENAETKLTSIKKMMTSLNESIKDKKTDATKDKSPEDAEFKEPLFNEPSEKEGKKVLYFHAKIKPLNASWMTFRAGGLLTDAGKATVQFVGQAPSTIAKYWNKFFGNKTAETAVATESVGARLAEAKVTAAKYLLARTTAVGVGGTFDDTSLYQYDDIDAFKKKFVEKIMPEIYKKLEAEYKGEWTMPTVFKAVDGKGKDQIMFVRDRLGPEKPLPEGKPENAVSLAYKKSRTFLENLLTTYTSAPLASPEKEEPKLKLAFDAFLYNKLQYYKDNEFDFGKDRLSLSTAVATATGANGSESTGKPALAVKAPGPSSGSTTPKAVTPKVGTPKSGSSKGGSRNNKKKQNKQKTRKQARRNDSFALSLLDSLEEEHSFLQEGGAGEFQYDPMAEKEPSILTWHYIRPENRFMKKLGQTIGMDVLVGVSLAFSVVAIGGIVSLASGAIAAGGIVAAGTSALAGATTLATYTSALATVGTAIGIGTVTAAAGRLVNTGLAKLGAYTGLTDANRSSFFMDNVERILFNDVIGMFVAFSNPEDDCAFINLMFSLVFSEDRLEIEAGRDIKDLQFVQNFPMLYEALYEKALNRRIRPWYAQVTEYSVIVPQDTGAVNVKRIISSFDKLQDYTRFLCFYMDPSFLSSALKTYPSTYNTKTGEMLNQYNKDRIKFMEDQAKKEEEKKGK